MRQKLFNLVQLCAEGKLRYIRTLMKLPFINNRPACACVIADAIFTHTTHPRMPADEKMRSEPRKQLKNENWFLWECVSNVLSEIIQFCSLSCTEKFRVFCFSIRRCVVECTDPNGFLADDGDLGAV